MKKTKKKKSIWPKGYVPLTDEQKKAMDEPLEGQKALGVFKVLIAANVIEGRKLQRRRRIERIVGVGKHPVGQFVKDLLRLKGNVDLD